MGWRGGTGDVDFDNGCVDRLGPAGPFFARWSSAFAVDTVQGGPAAGVGQVVVDGVLFSRQPDFPKEASGRHSSGVIALHIACAQNQATLRALIIGRGS